MQRIRIVLIIRVCMVLAVVGCHSGKAVPEVNEKHFLEIRIRGKGAIYVDKVPNGRVMQQTAANSSEKGSVFHSYSIGFIDSSLVADKKQELAAGRYFQYEMQQDWVMLLEGDSLRPCFFQPAVKLTKQKHEGILVFDVPAGKTPDSLIYLDSKALWGKHLVLLNYSNNNSAL